jgi:uncharacterized protein with von Willebrand factor type A (vWA) domain
MEASRNTASTTADLTAGTYDGVFRLETMQLDLPAVAGAFSQRLHDGGVSVTPAQSGQYVGALQLTQPQSRRQLYFTTRAIFVTDLQHVATFDRVFAEVFGSRAGTAADDVRARARPDGRALLRTVELEPALPPARV